MSKGIDIWAAIKKLPFWLQATLIIICVALILLHRYAR
jgi:hypothetical protein